MKAEYRDRKASGEALKEQVISLLFPRRCPVCEKIVQPRGELICQNCAKRLSVVHGPLCQRCGKELESDRLEYCPDCMKHHRSFERNFALLNYDDLTKHSLSAIKYRNKREFLDFYGEALCVRYGKMVHRLALEAIVPVPVHPSRKRTRGFNQAELLARQIGKRLEIPVCPGGLRREKRTLPQKGLGTAERLHNLRQAFAPGSLPQNISRVLLVDDIYTTGSTMEACTRVLLAMGVKKVYGMTICVGRL